MRVHILDEKEKEAVYRLYKSKYILRIIILFALLGVIAVMQLCGAIAWFWMLTGSEDAVRNFTRFIGIAEFGVMIIAVLVIGFLLLFRIRRLRLIRENNIYCRITTLYTKEMTSGLMPTAAAKKLIILRLWAKTKV